MVFNIKGLLVAILLGCFCSDSAKKAGKIAKLFNKTNSKVHWENFKRNHSKKYHNDSHETQKMKVFLNNLDIINKQNEKFNNGTATYFMDINSMSDMTSSEFNEYVSRGLNKSLQPSNNSNVTHRFLRSTVPVSVDWRTKGVVNPIKNQGKCGSCSAFSALSSLESAIAIKTGLLPELSEQNLVDCVYNLDMCIQGGWYSDGWNYIQAQNKNGIGTEENYPYVSGSTGYWSGVCKYNSTNSFNTRLTGYVQTTPNNEAALTQAIADVGPVSVSIYASNDFQHYSGGVFTDTTCPFGKVNHAVTLVGYGTDSTTGKDYYILKNQWGTSWGSNGYMNFSRNNNNMCGIASYAMYPIVAQSTQTTVSTTVFIVVMVLIIYLLLMGWLVGQLVQNK